MKDMVPKGTGNSRTLKSVSNFLTLYPTYNDFVAALVAGTLPIDLGPINSAGCDEVGTPLNKANLLTDATADALGINHNDGSTPLVEPTVDIAFQRVVNGLHNRANLDPTTGKVDPDQLSSRIIPVTLAATESLTLDSSYKNATIAVLLPSLGGEAAIIVPEDAFDVEDEFEVFVMKSDSSSTETLIIAPPKNSISKFNNIDSVSLSNNLDTAVFKCYAKNVAPEGALYPDPLYWLVKGDI